MRRALIALAVLLVLAAGAYVVYWQAAARTLADGIENWAAEQRRAGYAVSYEPPEIGGFPLRLEARIGAPEIAGRAGALPWHWRGPTLLLQARPWAPLDATVSVPGQHDITIGGAEARRYVVEAEQATGHGHFSLSGAVSELGLELGALVAAEEGVPERRLSAENSVLVLRPGPAGDHSQPSLEFQLSLAGVVLPAEADTPLGRELEKLELDGAVLGRIPETAATLEEALARWRDDGGTLELRRLVTHWGPLELTGDGTFALDGALQPIGAMSATVAGHDATMDAFVAAGMVSPRDGSIAKILLAALSRPSPVDGRPEVTAPVTLQDGYLWVGPAKLAPLPRVEWPAQLP